MNDYQIELISLFERYRPKPTYPTYPPYHKGLYLEDFFFDFFVSNNIQSERIYIPVSWTTLYCEHNQQGLQEVLNKLDQDKEYFTICQHDDIIKEQIPPKTMVFSCSQHIANKTVVPTPVTCSRIPKLFHENKKYFASFVGSYTHPIRAFLANQFANKEDCYYALDSWQNKVSELRFDEFLTITSKSKFTLCPRGYGNTSFRLYEAMQLGSVPVYISDDFCLPWSDEIDWNKFCVIIKEDQLDDIIYILRSIDENQYSFMRNSMMGYYEQYFSMEGACFNIIKRVI